MRTIEELVSLFASVPTADGSRWTVEYLDSERVGLSRAESGEFALFLSGKRDTFGDVPSWTGVEHSDDVVSVPSGRRLSALRITSSDQVNGNRVIAHIAYELARRVAATPDVSNKDLLESVSWILPLLGERDAVLPVARQYGLLGECILLRRLLSTALRLGIPPSLALERWKGAAASKRDFAAQGIAVEVKTTGHATRIHHFGSIEQLDPQQHGEEVFLFSVGTRMDASAPKKLPDFLSDVESGLVNARGEPDADLIRAFGAQLLSYGYRPEYEMLYRSLPGFKPPHLPPTFYRELELDRVRQTSFKGDSLPAMVLSVGYDLEVRGPGLTSDEAEAVLERLLRSPALSESVARS